MRTLTTLTVTVALGAGSIIGCGSSTRSASKWAAEVVTACRKLETDRKTAAATLPTDRPPTVEELMAFDAAFAPRFAAFGREIKALKRPNGLDKQIDEVISAVDGYAAALERAGTDRAAAQAELDADGQTKESARLEAAGTAAGLSECNA